MKWYVTFIFQSLSLNTQSYRKICDPVFAIRMLCLSCYSVFFWIIIIIIFFFFLGGGGCVSKANPPSNMDYFVEVLS